MRRQYGRIYRLDQCTLEFHHGPEAIRRAQCECADDCSVCARVNVRIHDSWADQCVVQCYTLYRCRRNVSCQEVIEGRSQAVDIGPRAGLSGSRILLRRGIAFGASLAHKCRGYLRAGQVLFGNAKIDKHWMARRCHYDVRGLYVAVENGRHA